MLTGLAPILFIWYGGYQVIQGTLSFGGFIAFYLYAARFYAPIQSLANRGVEIYNGLASAQRIGEYLELAPAITEPETPLVLPAVSGEISFKNVSFKYPGTLVNAVDGLNLNIASREKVAVVGPSGAGKTTLINLVCRLYDVSSGEIHVDGHNLHVFDLKFLRNSIGVVSQDLCLFNDSILNNIRFARPEASDDEVVIAARTAHLDFVEQLPKGFETIVGTRGLKLSAGQRQRIALARVVLKNPDIWFLDEFTSSLDTQTEDIIYENIAPLIEGKTAITITHRLSTAMLSDRIFVMQRGRCVETGTHASLCALKGLYSELFEMQISAVAAAASPSA
jgi:subfamily B ATP-binding cassette protein MsbA